MSCACQNRTPQPSVSSALPLYYLYRVSIVTFHFEQACRLQHSWQNPAAVSVLLSPDACKHQRGARLDAYTPLYLCDLGSVGVKYTGQIRAVANIIQLFKVFDRETGLPRHIIVPVSHRAYSLSLLLLR